jgi:cytochrome bd-type quinol oxidase subunit 2
MNNSTVLRRILYVGTALVIMAFLVSVFTVLPNLRQYNLDHSIPGNVFQFIWVLSFTHLLVVAALVYTIIISFREGESKYGYLVTAGIVLILLSISLFGSASDYSDHPAMQINAKSMYICCGLDFFAGVLSFMARYIRGHLRPVK